MASALPEMSEAVSLKRLGEYGTKQAKKAFENETSLLGEKVAQKSSRSQPEAGKLSARTR